MDVEGCSKAHASSRQDLLKTRCNIAPPTNLMRSILWTFLLAAMRAAMIDQCLWLRDFHNVSYLVSRILSRQFLFFALILFGEMPMKESEVYISSHSAYIPEM